MKPDVQKSIRIIAAIRNNLHRSKFAKKWVLLYCEIINRLGNKLYKKEILDNLINILKHYGVHDIDKIDPLCLSCEECSSKLIEKFIRPIMKMTVRELDEMRSFYRQILDISELITYDNFSIKIKELKDVISLMKLEDTFIK